MSSLRFKYLLLFCFFFLLFAFQPISALAVAVESGGLFLEHDAPLFPPDEIWYPGKTKIVEITVGNLGEEKENVGVRGEIAQDSISTKALLISFYKREKRLWGPDSMADFISSGEVFLSKIKPGEKIDFQIKIGLPDNFGNEYQGLSSALDLTFGFFGISQVINTGRGAEEDLFSCSSSLPGSPENLTASPANPGQAILTWSPPLEGEVEYYSIVYGSSPDNYLYESLEPETRSSKILSGLGGDTPHYFAVKAVNQCGEGQYSNAAEVLVKGEKGKFSPGQVRAVNGFGVLEKEGEVAGVSTTKRNSGVWLFLLLPLIYLSARGYLSSFLKNLVPKRTTTSSSSNHYQEKRD